MTLLSTVQQFCARTGLPQPNTVYGTTDPLVRQARALLEEEGNDLSLHTWEALTFEATHTSVATESQGAITSIATNGFRKIKNLTIWNRTDMTPIYGAVDPVEWQARKALVTTGPRYSYRIRGGQLLINPVPTAGLSFAFEYLSKNWILGADGVTYKQFFTLDTDTILLPEDLMLMGLRWRWKKEKGFDYGDDLGAYLEQRKSMLGGDGGKPALQMDSFVDGPRPGIGVPIGNWSVP